MILDPFDRLVGAGAANRAMRTFAQRAASVDAGVLLMGETGTGKGVLARLIHDAGLRAQHPFVAVNCAGIPESLFESEVFGHVRGAFTGALQTHKGLLEQAHGGTLFLDEIAELPLPIQAKLLTAIEDGEFRRVGAERTTHADFRLIAATSVDLLLAISLQRFRGDLFHRLNVLAYRIPPLRQRGNDCILLARHFAAFFAARYDRPIPTLEPPALAAILAHSWPGNVRELAHTIEAAVIAAERDEFTTHLIHRILSASVLAGPLAPNHNDPATKRQIERERIDRAMQVTGGNKTHAARMLGISRNTLLARLRSREMSQTAMEEPRSPFHVGDAATAHLQRNAHQVSANTRSDEQKI